MNHVARGMLFLIVAVAVAVAAAAAPLAAQLEDRPDAEMLLAQSELDFLMSKDAKISLSRKRVTPESVLRDIARKVPLEVEIRGALARPATLDVKLEDVTLKEALQWFADQTHVIYKVEDGNRLIVIPPKPE